MILQKIFLNDLVHTTVSSEAIRFAIRYRFQLEKLKVNRSYDITNGVQSYVDETHESWSQGVYFIDDDLMGFMDARAAKTEKESAIEKAASLGRKRRASNGRAKGTHHQRQSPLGVACAVSLRPYRGEMSFGCVSGIKTSDKVSIYHEEVHTTEYQYTFVLNMPNVVDKQSILHLLDAVVDPPLVGGKQARFYYDFSPKTIILRTTNDHSSRIQNCFEYDETQRTISIAQLLKQIKSGDVPASELVVGGVIAETTDGAQLKTLGATVYPGTKQAVSEMKTRVSSMQNNPQNKPPDVGSKPSEP